MAEPLTGLAAEWGVAPAELIGWLRALARALPTVVLLPALGFGPAAAPVRALFALVFAAAIVPVLSPTEPAASATLAVGAELARGAPIALVAAVALWAAFMAGDLAGRFGGADEALRAPLSWLLGLIASIAFLEAGGASALAEQLRAAPAGDVAWRLAAHAVARGIGVAVIIAAPVLLVAVLVEVVLAAVVRADPRGSLASGARALAPLIVGAAAALLLERVAEVAITLPR